MSFIDLGATVTEFLASLLISISFYSVLRVAFSLFLIDPMHSHDVRRLTDLLLWFKVNLLLR